MLARAAADVASSGSDSLLEAPATDIADSAVIFEAIDSEQPMDSFFVDAARSANSLLQIARTGSRNFKEGAQDNMMRFVTSITSASDVLLDNCQNAMDEFLQQKLTTSANNYSEAVDNLIQCRDTPMPPNVAAALSMIQSVVLEPLLAALEAKNMNMMSDCASNAEALRKRATALEQERVAWATLLDTLVTDAMHTEDKSQWANSIATVKDIAMQLAVLDESPRRELHQNFLQKIHDQLAGNMAQMLQALVSDFKTMGLDLKTSGGTQTPSFLPAWQNIEIMKEIKDFYLQQATQQATIIRHVALAAGDPIPIFTAQCSIIIDTARIATAEFLYQDSLQHSGLNKNEHNVEELYINQNIIAAMNSANGAIHECNQFLDCQRDPSTEVTATK